MIAEKVEGQIVQKMSFKFRLANHSDEPLEAKIVSAKASTIFESHLHCTKSELAPFLLDRLPYTAQILAAVLFR